VAVAAIFDKGRLQRRLYARDLGEIDIAAQLFALGGLEIKFFDAIAADHNDPGLFRVGGIDQHLVGHFGTLDGAGAVHGARKLARPGDATVHLIRGEGKAKTQTLAPRRTGAHQSNATCEAFASRRRDRSWILVGNTVWRIKRRPV